MTLYLCMSMAGSIPVMLCLILWIVQRNSYNFYLGKKLLLIGMFFYLAPFQAIKFKLPEGAVSVLELSGKTSVDGKFSHSVALRSVLTPGDSLWIPWLVSVLLILWLCCVILFAVYQIVRYRIDIRRLLAQSEKVSVNVDGKMVEVLANKGIYSPYAVGFLRQSIIVPEGGLEHPCFLMFYRHEEQHKINHDSLMKLLCIIIICIHILNPVTWLLLFLYNVTAEYICDAEAVKDRTKEEKKRYAELLIELSDAKEPLSIVWRNHLVRSEKFIKRRINYMMKEKKKGRLKRGIGIAATAVAVFASASTILAYEPLLSTGAKATEVLENNDNFTDFTSFSSNLLIGEPDFKSSDTIFIDEDGTEIAVYNEISGYALCNHKMTSGYLNVHKKNNSGGCTVYVYNAERCTKCGYIEASTLYSTITYPVCPH